MASNDIQASGRLHFVGHSSTSKRFSVILDGPNPSVNEQLEMRRSGIIKQETVLPFDICWCHGVEWRVLFWNGWVSRPWKTRNGYIATACVFTQRVIVVIKVAVTAELLCKLLRPLKCRLEPLFLSDAYLSVITNAFTCITVLLLFTTGELVRAVCRFR